MAMRPGSLADWPDPLEIRIHGRGGQGTVTLAALIVDSAFRSGWNVLGFPAFGTERTGAPVTAFVRLSNSPIFDRSEVQHPSVVIAQELIPSIDIGQGLAPNGLLLLNAARIPPSLCSFAVAAAPATDLGLRYLGVAKTSTAMLGFFAAITGLVTMDAVSEAILARFSGDVAERNVRLARAMSSGTLGAVA